MLVGGRVAANAVRGNRDTCHHPGDAYIALIPYIAIMQVYYIIISGTYSSIKATVKKDIDTNSQKTPINIP